MNKFFDFIEKFNMLNHGESVLVALSGGADSVCLLSLLHENAKNLGISVKAAHFNHQLRGSESDRDEAFVRALCKKLGIDLLVGRGNVKGFAEAKGIGIEEGARIMRYDFLEKVRAENGADKIATAHNADDNAETVILNLIRGTGLAGLGGIPPVRGCIVRPVLCLTRNEIENYIKEKKLEYVTDSSNLTDDYSRNDVRHNIMPLLKALNPRAAEHMFSASALCREDEGCLSGIADEFIKENCTADSVNAKALSSLPFSIASRVIRKMAGREISRTQVEDILKICRSDDPWARIDISGISVFREYDKLTFGTFEIFSFEPVVLQIGKSTAIPELGLEITLEEIEFADNINKRFTYYLFKTDDVCGKISVRSRKTGDKIRLAGTDCTKTLKKLFSEKSIPIAKREAVPVIADDIGALAVYGIGQGSRGVPSLGDNVYKITVKETD